MNFSIAQIRLERNQTTTSNSRGEIQVLVFTLKSLIDGIVVSRTNYQDSDVVWRERVNNSVLSRRHSETVLITVE